MLRLACVLSLVLCACAGGEAATQASAAQLSSEQLRDPETCKPCHAQHFREWQSSMHAYAAQDPVFIAMNERGQLQTQHELGEFCVRCHAPLALQLGLTTDGLNLPDLKDPSAHGVTCYFCHNASGVLQDHNQHLQLALDDTMHGGLGAGAAGASERNRAAAGPSSAHHSVYSALHDGERLDSASLCGGCHDVVNDHGVAIERTLAEWQQSRYAQPGDGQRSCGGCHMPKYVGHAVADGPERDLHRHMFAGVDVALEKTFPGVEAQKGAIDCAFAGAIELTLRASPDDPAHQSVDVILTNKALGHAFPSGAAQDRRAWVELVAYDADGKASYQSGVFDEGEVVTADGGLQLLREQLYDKDGQPVHMFWEAEPSAAHALGYESNVLAAGESRSLHYALPTPAARVTARLQLRSIGLEVLDSFQGLDLPISNRVIDNGYLGDGPVRGRIRTLTVPGTDRELRLAQGDLDSVPASSPSDACENQSYLAQLPQ